MKGKLWVSPRRHPSPESKREVRGACLSEEGFILLHESESDPVLGGYDGIEDFLADERVDEYGPQDNYPLGPVSS